VATVVLIDGQYLYREKKEIGLEHVDLFELVRAISPEKSKVYYFISDVPASPEIQEKHSKFISAISRLPGFHIVKGPTVVRTLTCPHCGQAIQQFHQKQVDIGLAVTALKCAEWAEVITLVTGDADFVPLLKELSQRSVWVRVVAGKTTGELIACADELVDLQDILRKLAQSES